MSNDLAKLFAMYMNYFAFDDQLTDWDQREGDFGEKCMVGDVASLTNNPTQWSIPHNTSSTLLMTYNRPQLISVGSVGCAGDNKPYCRICLSKPTQNELPIMVIIFQPFFLTGVNELSKQDLVAAFLSSSDEMAARDTDCVKTASKIVWTMNKVFDRQPVNLQGQLQQADSQEILIKKGDYDILTQWSYKTCVNLKSRAMAHGPGFTRDGEGMMGFIKDIVTAFQPSGVIFTGFSLGAGLSVPASLLLDNILGGNIGTVTCAGEASTNYAGIARMKEYALVAHNMVVDNDAVSGISGPWLHASPTMVFYQGGPAPDPVEVVPGKIARVTRRKERSMAVGPIRNLSPEQVGGRFAMVENYLQPKPSGQYYNLIFDEMLGTSNFRSAMNSAIEIVRTATAGGAIGAVGGMMGAVGAMATAPVVVPLSGVTSAGATAAVIPAAVASWIGAYSGWTKKVEMNFKRYHKSAQYLIPLALWENFVAFIPTDYYYNIGSQEEYFAYYGLKLEVPITSPYWCQWFDNNAYAKKLGVCPPSICKRVQDGSVYRCVPKLNTNTWNEAWSKAIYYGGGSEAIRNLSCDSVQVPGDAQPFLYSLEKIATCSKQSTSSNCAEFSILNAIGTSVEIPKKASIDDVAEVLAGRANTLYTCLNKDNITPRARVPHLIFSTDGSGNGFLIPYCLTSGGRQICNNISIDEIFVWMTEYKVFIILYEHQIGYPHGHYIAITNSSKGWSVNDSMTGGVYLLPTREATALLIRGSVAVFAVTPSNNCVIS